MATEKIIVAEHFYSIQGEGSTIGVPSVFLRLTGCNLTCGGPTSLKSKQIEPGATWRCDTMEVWSKGDSSTIANLLNLFESQGYLSALQTGAQLVITGGEPLLQQSMITPFLDALQVLLGFIPRIEIETNGTLRPLVKLDNYITQYNVSPKLTNCGLDKESRINHEALDFFSTTPKAIFKFVITKDTDILEIQTSYIVPFKISNTAVYLMPGADSRTQLHELGPHVAQWARDNGYRFSTRLHIELWDKKTGV